MHSLLSSAIHEWLQETNPKDWELAVVEQDISASQPGIAYWYGSYWFAQIADSSPQSYICSESFVKVLERQGQVLLVSSH